MCTITVYDTAWIGILPIATEGPDDQPGSIRTVVVPTAVGTYTFKETVSQSFNNPDTIPSCCIDHLVFGKSVLTLLLI